jgi:glyoxylate reductase
MKVLVTGRLPEEIVAALRVDHEVVVNDKDQPMARDEVLRQITDKHGLLSMLTDRVDEELIEKAPNLKMIANCAVGFNNVDIAAATKRGILVSNTPGVLTDATADLTFALILSVARRVVQGDAMTRSGGFKSWAPFLFLGSEVTGKTLGIIGLGEIGKAVALRARCFRMPVLYYNRSRLPDSQEQELTATYTDFSTLLSRSDFISLHVPLTDQTRHLIGKNELELMKRSAFLINASRGPVVDEKALLEALRTGVIAGAGLDVYENEPEVTPGLSDLANVVLLPHLGSATTETRTRMARLAVENLLAGLAERIPPNCLNYPGL